MKKRLILASSSPRRQQLLRELGINFTVKKPEIDEKSVKRNTPKETVERLAARKAQSIAIQAEDEIILAADTIVVHEGEIYEKPNNQSEALEMIRSFSGKTHEVITAVALRSLEKEAVFSVTTKVEFWPLAEAEMKAYVETDEPYDKAGAYGIQGLAKIFIKKIDGDYFNVVGLPVSHVVRELRTFGMDVEPLIFAQKQNAPKTIQ